MQQTMNDTAQPDASDYYTQLTVTLSDPVKSNLTDGEATANKNFKYQSHNGNVVNFAAPNPNPDKVYKRTGVSVAVQVNWNPDKQQSPHIVKENFS